MARTTNKRKTSPSKAKVPAPKKSKIAVDTAITRLKSGCGWKLEYRTLTDAEKAERFAWIFSRKSGSYVDIWTGTRTRDLPDLGIKENYLAGKYTNSGELLVGAGGQDEEEDNQETIPNLLAGEDEVAAAAGGDEEQEDEMEDLPRTYEEIKDLPLAELTDAEKIIRLEKAEATVAAAQKKESGYLDLPVKMATKAVLLADCIDHIYSQFEAKCTDNDLRKEILPILVNLIADSDAEGKSNTATTFLDYANMGPFATKKYKTPGKPVRYIGKFFYTTQVGSHLKIDFNSPLNLDGTPVVRPDANRPDAN